jgi:starch phosphorylase
VNYFRTISVMPKIPHKIKRLHELAYNLWFSWNPGAQLLFSILDKQLWEETHHNPVKFLMHIYPGRLNQAAEDIDYLEKYNQVLNDFDSYMKGESWFEKKYPEVKMSIAYFSAEIGVHESTPVYSGGLGVLAGDHCKSASDLGLPLTAIGILYKQGYFSQKITREGWQEEENMFVNFNEIPVIPSTHPDGSPMIIPVDIEERIVYIKVWQQQVGRITIYLLDTDVPLNSAEDRCLTSRLYGGNHSTRIAQEIILGVGGVKALHKLGIKPTVWHINEGHAAFLLIERIKQLVEKGVPYSTALEAVKASTIFTTHTPVPAGHDVFNPEEIISFFKTYIDGIIIDREKFLSLGWDEGRHGFNMTKLALNNSSYTNGVSKLHSQVSRNLFCYLFPRIPLEEIPINYINNGVHIETWVSPEMRDLFNQYLDAHWPKLISQSDLWKKVHLIPDQKLWEAHQKAKEAMLQFTKNNIYHRMRRNIEPVELIRESMRKLKKDTLVIGFARRFATYKRANLLLRDRNRLARLLNNPEMPVIIIFAGKAHPADHSGQAVIKEICDLEKDPEFRGRVFFIENYDLHAARMLVQGVDLWLNTPRRPLEASGTSGQKAALNGVLNCSILDGWWSEAFNGKNGFAIGSEKEYNNEEIQDNENKDALFDLLEQVIIPYYYHRQNGMPTKWITYMKESLATIPPYFNTERMVLEYCHKYYLPASAQGILFQEDSYQLAAELHSFKQYISDNWHHVAFNSIEVHQPEFPQPGNEIHVEANVSLGPIKPEDVIVEIYYQKIGDTSLENITLLPLLLTSSENGTYKYSQSFELQSGTIKYAFRIRPLSPYFVHIFSLPLVKWADNF